MSVPRRNLPDPSHDFEDEDQAPDIGDMLTPPAHNREGGVAPVGFYICDVEKIVQETQTLYSDYTRLRWSLRVLSVISARDRQKAREMVGQTISAWCNLAMGPKAAFRRWAEAALDRPLRDGEQFPLSALYSHVVEVSVVPHVDKENRETTKVEGLTAYRPEELDEAQKPPAKADEAPPRRVPTDAPRATARQVAGKPEPAREREIVTPKAPPAEEDAFTEPWDDEPFPGAVDPVLAARAARSRQ